MVEDVKSLGAKLKVHLFVNGEGFEQTHVKIRVRFTAMGNLRRLVAAPIHKARGFKMRRTLRLAVTTLFISLAAAFAAHAQVPYNQGQVERVTLIHILPGHSDAFFADIKKNVMPTWEAEKSAGLIVDYRMFLNQTANGPEDWDFTSPLRRKSITPVSMHRVPSFLKLGLTLQPLPRFVVRPDGYFTEMRAVHGCFV
jgi:hypothetical protein